ncbi:MAG: hypothetical protein ACK6CU_07210 [Deltaproteobacteria bacterium]|jgi:hypothetical protein
MIRPLGGRLVQDPNTQFGSPPTAPAPPPPGSSAIGDPAEDPFGWAGVGLGAVSWLACCCSIIPVVGMVGNILATLLAVAATVLGAVSVHGARREGRPIVVGAIAIALGAARLGLVLALIVLAVVLVALGVGGGFLASLPQLRP